MSEMNVEQARFNMIEQQVRTWEVLDQRVLNVMAAVPRERFVPERYQALAFADIQIPIGEGQVMMEPKLEGRVLQALALQPTDHVLEVGTGSGYLTACLAKLAAHVVTVEKSRALSEAAHARLDALGLRNVVFRIGDAAGGWADDGQFDAIALTGACPKVPEVYKHQLKVGGRLFVVVGEEPIMEALLITRLGAQEWSSESLFDTKLPLLEGVRPEQHFVF